MTDEGQKRSERTDPGDAFRESVRAVTGILGAFKDAIEQTFNDLSDRGDIAPDRAKDAARDTMRRVQDAMEEMRGRVDFVTRREYDSLKAEVDELRSRLDRHEGPAASGVGDGSPGI
jgi:polyhydroxyalkanoate synthesis regulator phasin